MTVPGAVTYEYELRDGDEVIATGRFTIDTSLAPGDRVTIGKHACVVTDLLPAIAEREARVILAATSEP